MEIAVVAACAVLGLLVGSFANVVIHRVPLGESIVRPPSACPQCGAPIRPSDNIPVVSWLLLRGRCRQCGEPISAQYPVVELGMGIVFAAVALRIGADWSLPGFLLFAWLLVVVAIIDLRTRKIPNRLTYPLTPALAVLMIAAAVLSGDAGRIVAVLAGGVAGFVALFVLALIQPRGMGMGDVKLAGFIGLGLGYLSGWHVLFGLFGAFVFGGLVAIVLMLTGLRRRRDLIPFGPYLSVGALVVLLFGDPFIDAYRASLGLV